MTGGGDDFETFVTLALAGDIDGMAAMLAAGHDINAANDAGETAFSWCCANNCLASARFLAARGAHVNTTDAGGGTPLDWAVCWSSPEFRAWLQSIGGRRNADHDSWSWPPDGSGK